MMMDLRGRPAVVIGGGAVAERKARSLIDCGARVTVIAPELTSGLQGLVGEGALAHRARPYEPGDLDGAAIAFVAVDDDEASAAIAEDARSAGIPVNVADRPELCDFIVPSVVDREPLTIAVSTGGASPAWARKIREGLDAEFGDEYCRLLDAVEAVRRRCLKEISDPERRRQALRSAADDAVLELARGLKGGDLESAILKHVAPELEDA